MKPLIFRFKETPAGENDIDFSLICYDEKLNLSVNKLTGKPAIGDVGMETETFTRQNETSDSDYNGVKMLMDTMTATKTGGEGADDDPSRIGVMMETQTSTFTKTEGADDDKNRSLFHH